MAERDEATDCSALADDVPRSHPERLEQQLALSSGRHDAGRSEPVCADGTLWWSRLSGPFIDNQHQLTALTQHQTNVARARSVVPAVLAKGGEAVRT